LERAIDVLGAGDVLIIEDWDRATRSMMDGINIIQRVADKSWLDLSIRMGKGIILG
jgi:DNA invertase Pin-like site-specific DNA recombinase